MYACCVAHLTGTQKEYEARQILLCRKTSDENSNNFCDSTHTISIAQAIQASTALHTKAAFVPPKAISIAREKANPQCMCKQICTMAKHSQRVFACSRNVQMLGLHLRLHWHSTPKAENKTVGSTTSTYSGAATTSTTCICTSCSLPEPSASQQIYLSIWRPSLLQLRHAKAALCPCCNSCCPTTIWYIIRTSQSNFCARWLPGCLIRLRCTSNAYLGCIPTVNH